MKKTKVQPIVVKRWPSCEMAEIWQGKEQHFVGNYWDFHPGCMGTDFRINGKWKDVGREWKGVDCLANLLARLTNATIVYKEYKRDWNG